MARRQAVQIGRLADDLLADPAYFEVEEAWVCVEYTDALPQADAMRRLQERFAYCAKVVHAPATVREGDGRTYVQRVRGARSDAELVEAFLGHVRAGEGASEVEADILRDVLDERVRAEALA